MNTKTLLIVLLLPAANHAAELTWAVLPVLGEANTEDNKPIDSQVLQAHRLLEEALPQYTHKYITSSPNRAIHQLSQGVEICTTISIQTQERDLAGHFIPFLPSPPIHLAVRTDLAYEFQAGSPKASLIRILKETNLKGVIATNRGYPKELQELISDGISRKQIIKINSNSWSKNLLDMVKIGRADYTFEYPVIIKRYSALNNQKLTNIPILENKKLSPAGIYCPRNAWGNKVATDIDAAIQKISTNPDIPLSIYRQIVDNDTFEEIKDQLINNLKQRSTPEKEQP